MSSISFFPSELTSNKLVVDELVKEFNLTLYTDDHLVADAALKFSVEEDKFRDALFKKVSVFNQFTLEKNKAINMLKHVLATKLASDTSYLFYGFHSLLIPREITEVLRILVICGKQDRIAIGVDEGKTESEAIKLIKSADIIAFNWADFLYKKEAFDSSLYDLVVPCDLDNKGNILTTIGKFYHNTAVLRSSESLMAINDMSCATQVEEKLLKKGHVVSVTSNDCCIELMVHKSSLNFSGLQKDLQDIASSIPEVKKVDVRRAQDYSVSVYRQQDFELPSKVLFVDDEKDFVQTVSERLINRNVGTYGLYSGEDALQLISEDSPDVMVLDLKMPGMQGVDVLRAVKTTHPEIEVIILTGHGSIDDEKECMDLGAYSYINKPVDIEVLSEAITSAHMKAKTLAE